VTNVVIDRLDSRKTVRGQMLAQGVGDVIVVDWASSINDTGALSRRHGRGSLAGLGTLG